MKYLKFTFLLLLFGCNVQTDYEAFKSAQDYNVPLMEFHRSESNKVALALFPHADDEIHCAGAILELIDNDWDVYLMIFEQDNEEALKDLRHKELVESTLLLGIREVVHLDLPSEEWEDVINGNVPFWHDSIDSVVTIIKSYIDVYQPSTLISYDTIVGGYGHPAHRMSALAASRAYYEFRNDTTFPVKRIIQSTMPENMEQLMLADSESYKLSLQRTGYSSLPEPGIAVDVYPHWPTKRQAAAAYVTEDYTLRKFNLLPEIRDTAIHYKTFDREYYYLIE
jgi:LmbE family N-acetylglucosaminyl deacetylase